MPGARVQVAIQLATFSARKSCFSGMEQSAGTAGADAAQMFVAGIGPKRIMIEGRSRNAAENAAFSQILVQPDKGADGFLLSRRSICPEPSARSERRGFR